MNSASERPLLRSTWSTATAISASATDARTLVCGKVATSRTTCQPMALLSARRCRCVSGRRRCAGRGRPRAAIDRVDAQRALAQDQPQRRPGRLRLRLAERAAALQGIGDGDDVGDAEARRILVELAPVATAERGEHHAAEMRAV